VFSDDIRDAIKGSVFDHHDRGFVSGKSGTESSIRFGVVASLPHPQVDFSRVNYSKEAYAAQPFHTITYAECHDNHVLHDKLAISVSDRSDSLRSEMHRLAIGMLLTSQGIVFLHAGTEFRRSKKGVENSYESPDSINAIDWTLKTQQVDFYQYVRSLIQIRKSHPAFRFPERDLLIKSIRFDDTDTAGVVSYQVEGNAIGDSWKKIWVRYSNHPSTTDWRPGNGWKPAILNNRMVYSMEPVSALQIRPLTLTVLYQ
jgi:pullulanase